MKLIWKLSLGAAMLASLAGCAGQGAKKTEPEEIGILVTGDVPAEQVESLRQAAAQWSGRPVVLLEGDKTAPDIIAVSGGVQSPGLREKDYVIRFQPHRVTVEGGAAGSAEKGVKQLMDHYLTGENRQTLFAGTLAEERMDGLAYRIRSFSIQGAPLWEYVIVQGEGEEAQRLQTLLETASTYSIPVVTARELKEGTPAFIFGSSGARSAQTHSQGLKAGECRFVSEGSDLYFCAGDRGDELLAMKMFLAKYLDFDYYSGIAANPDVAIDGDISLTFAVNFDGTEGWQSQLSLVAKVKTQEGWTVQQGGCSDGRYAYYLLNNQATSTQSGKIVKFDMSDWSVVAVSEKLATDHGNDLAYNPKLGRIIAVHNKPNYTTLSIIDPETLTVERTVDLGEGIKVYSIGYSEERDRYILGASGTHNTFHIVDSEFRRVETAFGPDAMSAYTNQGCFADENYVYSIRSGSQNKIDDNRIFVNDWTGAQVTEILLDLPTESENLYRIGNLWYTAYYSSGGVVYETILYKELG